jgi:hypothetical protein
VTEKKMTQINALVNTRYCEITAMAVERCVGACYYSPGSGADQKNMGLAYVGYKLLRLIGLARQPDVLARSPDLARLDTVAAWVRAVGEFSVQRTHANRKLRWPEAPLKEPTVSHWLTKTFQTIDAEMGPVTNERNRDENRLAAATDKVIDCSNRVTGALADCLASFVTDRYRIGPEIFLADTLEAFNAGVEQVYPSTSYLFLRELAGMNEGAELVLEQDDGATNKHVRLIVSGFPSSSPEPNRLKVGLPFHARMPTDSMRPMPSEGWKFALFNLREDGDVEQFAPSKLTEPFYSQPAFTVSAQRHQPVTPNVGVTAEKPEAGTLLLATFRDAYPDWALLRESPLLVSAIDPDHSFERAQLGRFAQWIMHERKGKRAAIAIARFRCTR